MTDALRGALSDQPSNQGDSPMDTTAKPEKIDQLRRSFFGAAAMTVAAAEFVINGPATANYDVDMGTVMVDDL